MRRWWLCPRSLTRELRERIRGLFVVDAVAEARKISKELGTRPFSDRYHDSSGDEWGKIHQRQLRKVPPHPRSTNKT